jgi:hypothetical protein
MDRFSEHEILKAYSFSYDTLNLAEVDVLTLLFIEFANGKTITIDHSLQNTLENLQTLRTNKVHGI